MAEYLTLGVDREVFAIPVNYVQEILDMQPIARLPHAPHDLLGIIDVRGNSVPVVDLRSRLGMAPIGTTASTRIVVLELDIDRQTRRLGLLADRVIEVTRLDQDQLDPPPELGGRGCLDCVMGIGRRQQEFVIVFDVVRLVGIDTRALDMADRASCDA